MPWHDLSDTLGVVTSDRPALLIGVALRQQIQSRSERSEQTTG